VSDISPQRIMTVADESAYGVFCLDSREVWTDDSVSCLYIMVLAWYGRPK
jgi:hypothetical protein